MKNAYKLEPEKDRNLCKPENFCAYFGAAYAVCTYVKNNMYTTETV